MVYQISANCSLYFNDEMLITDHLGCTNEFAFNYDSLATINNGSCIDNLNAVVVSNSPLCHNDYGSSFSIFNRRNTSVFFIS